MNENVSFLTLPDRRLAYQHLPGGETKKSGFPLFFLGGYASDMTGSKASFLAEKCGASGRGFLRFDYRGHGRSSGKFIDGTIGAWFDDALQTLDNLTEGPQLVIGSSMGGWIALLLAKARPDRFAGFIGIASAPDFSEELVLPGLTQKQREQLEKEGMIFDESSPPDHRIPITGKFIEEARNHIIMGSPIDLPFAVHLLQGQKDMEVPWHFALRLADNINAPYVRLTLIKDGDHSLSRPEDLDFLWQTVLSFA